MMEGVESIEELKIFAVDALGTPEQVNFQSLRRVLCGILGYLAFLTGEAFDAEGVHVPANPQLYRRLGRAPHPSTTSNLSKTSDRQRDAGGSTSLSASGFHEVEDDSTEPEKAGAKLRPEAVNKTADSVPVPDKEEECARSSLEETGGDQDGDQEAEDKAEKREDKLSEKKQRKEKKGDDSKTTMADESLRADRGIKKKTAKKSFEKDKDALSEKEDSGRKRTPKVASRRGSQDEGKATAARQDGSKDDAKSARRDAGGASKEKLKPSSNADVKPKYTPPNQSKQPRKLQRSSTYPGGVPYDLTDQQQKEQQEADNYPGTSAPPPETVAEDMVQSTSSSVGRSAKNSLTRVEVSNDDHPSPGDRESQERRDSQQQETSTGLRTSASRVSSKGSKLSVKDTGEIKAVTGSASDTDEYNDPLYPSKADTVQRQDLDDIVKRLELVENNVSRMRSAPGSATPVPPGSPANTDAPLGMAEYIRSQSKVLDKKMELTERELQDEMGEIRKMIAVINAQLLCLPNPPELYKSYFPSWKMLEDILSPIPTLRQTLKDMRELAAASTDIATLTAKQTARFLGNHGPSERLLNILEELGRLVRQGQQLSSQQQTLAEEVAEMKTKMASKQLLKGVRKTPGGNDVLNVSILSGGQSTDENDGMTEGRDASDASKGKLEIQPFSAVDSGYLGFKLSKLGEDVFGIRREMDELQYWKDKINFFGDELKQLQDIMLVLKRDLTSKDERDHHTLTNIQMVLSEFQQELCNLENKKAVQHQRMEMDSWRASVRTVESPIHRGPGGIVMDREARIRTQQLQMQVNTLHQMMLELQTRFPDQQFSPYPSGLPEDMQYPWGTGRSGPSMVMRSGGGISATPVSPPPARALSPPRTVGIPRPSSVGGASEPQAPTSPHMEAELQEARQKAVVDAYGGLPKYISVDTAKQMEEEKAKLQQTITRLNNQTQVMAAKLEACLNQQTSESRRLQDLMSRMHKETMIRYNEMQQQLEEFLNEEYDLLNEGHVASAMDSENQPLQIPAAASPEGDPPPSSGPRHSRQSATRSALLTLRKELMGFIKALRQRITNLENGMPVSQEQDAENAAVLKRPIFATFQCLSCDRRVDITKPLKGEGEKLIGFVPPGVPEFPRLAPICSPPRFRLAVKGPRVKPPDIYHIPRQCGGSYTASNKPRRIYYYSNLGEALETAMQIPAVERVDMKGTDGHIYKGHLYADMDTGSTSFSSPTRNRVDENAL